MDYGTLFVIYGIGSIVSKIAGAVFVVALIVLIIQAIRKKKKKAALIIMIVSLVIAIGCSIAGRCVLNFINNDYTEDLDAGRIDQAITDENGNIRYKIGDFSYTDDNGNIFDNSTLSQYKYTIVNLWEPYCTPCKLEMPDLEKLYQDYKDKGVNLVGIYSTDKDKAPAIISDAGITYSTVYINSENESAFDTFSAGNVPVTFILDSEGYLVPLDLSEEEINKYAGEDAGEEMRAFYNGVVPAAKTYDYWAEKLDALLK